jgi:hypothetical protein
MIDGLTRAQLQKPGLEELNGTRKSATGTIVQRHKALLTVASRRYPQDSVVPQLCLSP